MANAIRLADSKRNARFKVARGLGLSFNSEAWYSAYGLAGYLPCAARAVPKFEVDFRRGVGAINS